LGFRYFGKDWGFANYLKAALDEVSKKIKVEVTRLPSEKKGNRAVDVGQADSLRGGWLPPLPGAEDPLCPADCQSAAD
jgi:hypothetical protein